MSRYRMWEGWFSAVCPVHIIWIYGCQDSLLGVSQHSKPRNSQSSGSSLFKLFCFQSLFLGFFGETESTPPGAAVSDSDPSTRTPQHAQAAENCR